MYDIVFSNQAIKDYKIIRKTPYYAKLKKIITLIQEDPYKEPPLFEPLIGQKKYSRHINLQHRLVYTVNEDKQYIVILSCWTHYHT